jgi:hypothetical protein
MAKNLGNLIVDLDFTYQPTMHKGLEISKQNYIWQHSTSHMMHAEEVFGRIRHLICVDGVPSK